MIKCNMNILILGGTGAMGKALGNILANKECHVSITSRTYRENQNNIEYIKGNALDIDFLRSYLVSSTQSKKWDAIIDFMSYSTEEFRQRVELMLATTQQYVFISSARVYAQNHGFITEDAPRLLDILQDEQYLKTDEYALAKARQEDLLRRASSQNWTIVRPSITYDDERMQLGVLEKEHWLYRALQGRSIIFSEDIARKYTVMTAGKDAAKGIEAIIGETNAMGEAFHIVGSQSYTWNEILGIYLDVLEDKTGKRPEVIMTDISTCFKADWNKYQIIYCRYYDRRFDNSKINRYINTDEFVNVRKGIEECLEQFLTNRKFKYVSWMLEGINDRVSGEYARMSEIPKVKMKIIYFLYRYHLDGVLAIVRGLKRMIKSFWGIT